MPELRAKPRLFRVEFDSPDNFEFKIDELLDRSWGGGVTYIKFQQMPEPGSVGIAWVCIMGFYV